MVVVVLELDVVDDAGGEVVDVVDSTGPRVGAAVDVVG